ncbi:MAG TPA: aldehyde dehydrogenase family protein [Jiangellaceae bacterium]|nr:aldehyde dehydrogenase family protein [Jiangellaceae bacterium]
MSGVTPENRLLAEEDEAVVDAQCLVAGRWCTSTGRAERIGPHARRIVSVAHVADSVLVDQALAYARQAQAVVERLSPAARADVLDRAADLVDRQRDDFARLLALELGKPVRDGRGEMVRVGDTLRVSAAEARRIGGEVLPTAGWQRGVGTTAMTYRAPVGVVVAITPFNAPANLLAHKLAASFAAGNTTIVKPPPQAPAVSARLVQVLLEAGMPVEAVQIVHGGADVGSRLCESSVVSAVSFTGSAAAGAAVARAAGPKRLVLELGGNAATIVCEDADIEAAAAMSAATGFSNSGQSCISVQRIYVHTSAFDRFTDALTAAVRGLTVGDPLDPATDVGSMVDDDAASRVEKWIKEAEAGGAIVTCGGSRDGATLAPTVVAEPDPRSDLVVEEAFGAVVAVLRYESFDEVIDICNKSRYGLQAGLFTQNIARVFDAWRRLEVGGLIVNGTSNFRLDHVPFGGVKDSGIGRESPRWMIDDYTVTKTLILRGMSIWGDESASGM